MRDQPLTFIHITDLHVNAPGIEDDMLFNDTTETMRRTLAEIARMDQRPDFIIASGDLTNHGEPESYRTLKALIAEADLGIPVLYTLGNHDKRAGFAEVFSELHSDSATPYDHDAVVSGLHVILMESAVPGEIGGYWEAGQIDWLKARLADHSDLPKLLVMHHAPMLDTDAADMEWESLSIAATEELRQAIEGRNIVGILAGHIHLDRVSHWYGVPVIVGTGHHAGTDAVALPAEFNMLDATGFAICTLRPSGLSVTYVAHPQSRDVRHRLDMGAILAHIAEQKAKTAAE